MKPFRMNEWLVPNKVKMKLKNSIHLEFCLCLLKDLFRNDSPITICSFNLQLSLLIETSTS